MFVIKGTTTFPMGCATMTPEALESAKATLASSEVEHKLETKKRKQYHEKQLVRGGRIQL